MNKLQEIEGLIVHIFFWSGRNSFIARRNAATALAIKVRKLPDGEHVFLLGHSHGGTVAHFAAEQLAEDREIGVVLTLSTPFIYARRRPNAAMSGLASASLVGVAIFGWLAFLVLDVEDYWHFLVALAPAVVATLAVWRFCKWIKEIKTPACFAGVDKRTAKAVCYRAPGDEASLAIGIAQFILWFSSVILVWFTFAAERMVAITNYVGANWLANAGLRTKNSPKQPKWTEVAEKSRATANTIGFLVVGGFLLLTVWFSNNIRDILYPEPLFTLGPHQNPNLDPNLLVGPLPLVIVFGALFCSVLTAYVTAGIGVVIVLSLSVLAGFAFGPEAFGKAVFEEFSVETSPPGAAEIVMVKDAPVSVSFTGMHSLTYESDEVIENTCDRIETYMRTHPTRLGNG